MSSASTLHRSSQRRPNASVDESKAFQPAPPPAPNSTQHAYSGSQSMSSRNSSGSGSGTAGTRTSSGRKRDPSQQLSQIEKSVTHLLIATKQLLETLTQWSRHQATEGEVSDVYVRLGYEFNIACRAFTSIGVDISDLGNVPDLLRTILEDTLSQDPSPASLDRYLPRIRDIIINLLHGLKRKQQKLRTRPDSNGQTGVARQESTISSTSAASDADAAKISRDVQDRLSATVSGVNDQSKPYTSAYASEDNGGDGSTSSATPNNGDQQQENLDYNAGATAPYNSRRMPPSALSEESITKDSAQALPIQHPSPTTAAPTDPNPRHQTPPDVVPRDFPAPPPVPEPQPRSQDALAQLQRGGELERRASRRYSAYQIQKHLGQSPGSVPMLPPTQHGPIPNRGLEQRDSMNAVRSRSSIVRSRSTRFNDASPSRNASERNGRPVDQSSLLNPTNKQGSKREGSPLSQQSSQDEPETPQSPGKSPMVATLSGPLDMTAGSYQGSQKGTGRPNGQFARSDTSFSFTPKDDEAATAIEPFVPAQSPEPGTPLTLFLQYKSKIKKCVLPNGASDLSVGRLQLAFIEKFAWHTYNNGVDLPEIYIQDPVSGVRHELEDLSDIKDRTVLVLDVEVVDEVKRHFDGTFGGIQSALESMRALVEKQQTCLNDVSTKQEEASKEIARLASTPQPAPRASTSGKYLPNGARSLSGEHVAEVQSLRRDLAIMRQTLTTFTTGIKSSMDAIREKAALVKAKAADASLPSSDAESGRAYVNAGKKIVGDDSENLVNKVDDLQDIVEDLRKDVTRGVRPRPDHAQTVTNDIRTATELLNKMKDTVKREKPTWTKIWEKELELVCTDREFLTLQEELIADLEDDLEKANQTFSLVQEATKQQQHHNTSSGSVMGTTLRNVSRGFGPDADEVLDPDVARAGVMGEVRALQPNHESRLEAIERAEKARKKDLATRKDGAFTKELSRFVEDGKLRKTGGVDEIERVRLIRDDQNLKTTWDVEQEDKARRKKERAEKKKREAAERAALAEAEAAADADGTAVNGSNEAMHTADFGAANGSRSNSAAGKSPDEFQNIYNDSQAEDPAHEQGDQQRKSWLPALFLG